MSEKHEPGMAYSMPKLNKIMAILSFLLLITTVWVFLDDYIRPWKAIQVEGIKIKRHHAEMAIQAAQKELDAPKLKELRDSLVSNQKIVDTRKSEIADVEKQLVKVRTSLKALTIKNGFYNADSTALNYQYELAASEGNKEEAKEKLEKLVKLKADFAIGKNSYKADQVKEKALIAKLEDLNKEVLTTEKQIKAVAGKLELLEAGKKLTDMGPIFALRNLPFLDFLDPTIKIEQIVVANVTDDRYFRQVEKVDRCITCHRFIDQPGYEKEKNPFKTHPKLDLMVGVESKHPMKQIGCTACHGGEGHRVNDFSSAAHMPDNAKQEEEWVKKYNWKEPHHIQQPMLRLSQTEAYCAKCHTGQSLIPGATVLNQGRQLIEKYGCFSCHKIQGWGENRRKPGPSLLKIASKVEKEWFKAWVWYPKSINPKTKMPAFFDQVNNSSPKFTKLNLIEVNSMAEYIWEKSKDYKPTEKYRGGNVEHGKKLISEIGCLGCHGVQGLEEQSEKIGNYAGPFLYGLGSKVQADWLLTWLKKPSHYQEDTIMPSMRLTDQEANDISAYLLSFKNEKIDGTKFIDYDKKERDELLADYLSAFDTIEVAREKVAKMDDHFKTIELGRRSIGKYGCYTCHNIEGFNGIPPIGTELTKEGSKPITQFAFGIQHQVPHSRDGWITAHLQNPRMWDIGIDKAFRDLLRMPNFNMPEAEAKKITTALLGQVADVVPMTGMKRYTAGETLYNEAMKVTSKYNCYGCHMIDGLRGDIRKGYEDVNQAPPMLVREGHRVQQNWLYHFLGNVQPIRTYLTIRMPSFNLSLEEKNILLAGFQQGANQGAFEEPAEEVVWMPGERDQAIKLFNAYACTTCHTIGFNKGPALAPDLHKASARLRPSWIKLWLRDPQKILPGTIMPTFFTEDGKANEMGILEGNADKQIEALAKYVIELGGVGPKKK